MWLGSKEGQEEALTPPQEEYFERNLIVGPHKVMVAWGLIFAENIIGFCFHSLQPAVQLLTAVFKVPASPPLCPLLNGWLCLLLKKKKDPGLNCPPSCPQCACRSVCTSLKLPVSREEVDFSTCGPAVQPDFPGTLYHQLSSLSHLFLDFLFAGSSLPTYELTQILATQLYPVTPGPVSASGYHSCCLFSHKREYWQEHSCPGVALLPLLVIPQPLCSGLLLVHSNSLRKLQILIFSSAKCTFVLKQKSHLTTKQKAIFVIWFESAIGDGGHIQKMKTPHWPLWPSWKVATLR